MDRPWLLVTRGAAALAIVGGGAWALVVIAWFVAAFAADVSGLSLGVAGCLVVLTVIGLVVLVVRASRARHAEHDPDNPRGRVHAQTERVPSDVGVAIGYTARVTLLLLGALFSSAIAAFYLGMLGIALSERGYLSLQLSTIILDAKRSQPPMRLTGVLWVALSPVWIVPLIAGALSRPERMLAFVGVAGLAYIIIAAVALMGIFSLGPPV